MPPGAGDAAAGGLTGLLTAAELAAFGARGYLKLPGIVDAQTVAAVCADIDALALVPERPRSGGPSERAVRRKLAALTKPSGVFPCAVMRGLDTR